MDAALELTTKVHCTAELMLWRPPWTREDRQEMKDNWIARRRWVAAGAWANAQRDRSRHYYLLLKWQRRKTLSSFTWRVKRREAKESEGRTNKSKGCFFTDDDDDDHHFSSAPPATTTPSPLAFASCSSSRSTIRWYVFNKKKNVTPRYVTSSWKRAGSTLFLLRKKKKEVEWLLCSSVGVSWGLTRHIWADWLHLGWNNVASFCHL